jgi:hypothetical protein
VVSVVFRISSFATKLSAPPLQLWGMVPDLTGGFHQLSGAYQDFVSQNMDSILSLHTAIFVLW